MNDGQFYALDSLGMVIARGAVPEQQNAYVDRALAGRKVAKFSILALDEVFMDLMTHPWIVDACTRAIGSHFRFDHAFGLQQPPACANLHGGPQACHSSCFYQSGLSVTGAAWMGRLSVGISLTPQCRETGGLAYIPGSHKSSFLLNGSAVLKAYLNNDFEHECINIPTL